MYLFNCEQDFFFFFLFIQTIKDVINAEYQSW